jgi:NAD+ synthase
LASSGFFQAQWNVALPVHRSNLEPNPSSSLPPICAEMVSKWLIEFLRFECTRRRKITKVVLGLSGGVDSAAAAFLCAQAFGPENVLAVRMPYKISSPESLSHAQLVIEATGIQERTIPITDMVDGFAHLEPDMGDQRLGNVCARCRTTILFDQSMKIGGLPIGTGNKSERLLGYYTWHADDAPPINPLGDLFKTHVWQLAASLGVPEVIVGKPATADLIKGQTDEGDFGISYLKADRILDALIRGYATSQLEDLGFPSQDVQTVWKRLNGTHWKRELPTVAVLSSTAIGEFYLRPVDY